MIARLIRWSIENRFLVLLATLMICAWGLWAMLKTPLDAIPDLSDVQVIIRTSYPGQAPQIVEDQVTYPLTTTMLSVPGAKNVRGYSFFGDSFVYVLFDDGTETAQRLAQPPVALPMAVAHAGATQGIKQRTQRGQYPRFVRRGAPRSLWQTCGNSRSRHHRNAPSACFAKALRASSTGRTCCARVG